MLIQAALGAHNPLPMQIVSPARGANLDLLAALHFAWESWPQAREAFSPQEPPRPPNALASSIRCAAARRGAFRPESEALACARAPPLSLLTGRPGCLTHLLAAVACIFQSTHPGCALCPSGHMQVPLPSLSTRSSARVFAALFAMEGETRSGYGWRRRISELARLHSRRSPRSRSLLCSILYLKPLLRPGEL